MGIKLASVREKLEAVSSSISYKKVRKEQLSGSFPTELVEHNNSLLLTYSNEWKTNE